MGTVVETRLNPSGRTVRTNWIPGKTRWGATVSIRIGNHTGIGVEAFLNRLEEPSGRTGSLERHPVTLESYCLEQVERWKGALGRWSHLAWKRWSAGKAPWGAGSVLLGKSGALEGPWSAGSLLLGKNIALETHPGALAASCLEKVERWKGRWSAGSLLLRKTGALDTDTGALETSCLEKVERWKGTLRHWKPRA